MKRALLAAGALLLAFLMPARAAYDDLGTSARATGMGGAFTAVADDVYSIYYNPAGLATLNRPELATTYSKLLAGLSDSSNIQNSFFAYAHPLSGQWGGAGLAWNYFTLDSLYSESSLFVSYGAPIFAESLDGALSAGGSFKYLSRSVSGGAVAGNALSNTGVALGTPDPVLQHGSESTPDFDLGLLYRLAPRWTLGADVQHLLEPNIAFAVSDSDLLKRNYKFGAAYRTPFTTLSSDLQFTQAPDGSAQKTGVVAAEKWLPTLMFGTFGVRGALAAGDNDFRQLSFGLSYKIYKLEFDYGFQIPLGGITGTFGNQRIGLTWRFGRNSELQPKVGEALLENIETLADVGTPELRYQLSDLALYKRRAVEQLLKQVELDLAAGQFAAAQGAMDQAMALKPTDPKAAQTQSRVALIASAYPEVKGFSSDPAQAALYNGLLKYVRGLDEASFKDLAYARSMLPNDEKLGVLMKALGAPVPVAATVAAAAPMTAAVAPPPAVTAPPAVIPAAVAPSTAAAAAPVAVSSEASSAAVSVSTQAASVSQEEAALAARKILDGTVALLEVAMTQRDYEKVIQLAQRVLELDAANALAYRRLGVAYHALKKYPEAYRSLSAAYRLETDPKVKADLRVYMNAIAELTRPKAHAPARKPSGAVTPQDIERMYDAGVELYAEGKLSEAAEMFRKVLGLAPDDVSARRALKRVEAELYEAGEKR